MFRQLTDTIRRGAVNTRTVLIYLGLWALGVPGLLLIVLFLFGFGQ
jgi:hypothetical protein